VATSVTGATHGLEINGDGRFWWQNGENSTVAITVSFNGPLREKRVFLRFMPNLCYTKTDLRVRYSDSSGVERETLVSINKKGISIPIDVNDKIWWKPIGVQVDFPETSCSLLSDPRNFGVGIREAVLK
jgi:hypothetical protein